MEAEAFAITFVISHDYTLSLRTRLNSSAARCTLLGLGVLRLVLQGFSHSESRFTSCASAMSDFKLAVDENSKATELPLLRVCGTVQQNPHMRAFWASTISFFLAFLGWFALAPLSLEVATSIGQCENQLYPPAQNPTRPAY